MHTTCAELAARDGRSAAEMLVMHRQVHVRKPRAAMQRSKAAAVEVVKTALPESSAAPPAPPRMEMVTRSEREPADRTPASAPAESKAETTAEPEERNISWRPDRLVKRVPVGRTRPPSPTSVDIHPAAVVIRSPAPIIVRNPGPSPIRLIHPVAIAIRSPVRVRFRWPPHLTVIGNFRPGAVVVEIFGSNVVIVGLPARCRIADDVVAIGVPLVPIIAGRGFADLVLRLIARALNGNELALRSRACRLAES